MGIKSWSLTKVFLIVAFSILIWIILGGMVDTRVRKRIWQYINMAMSIVALCGILSYTVLNRTPSDVHKLTFFADYTKSFYREMVLNAFLYFPFGLALSTLIGPISIPLAFILSLSIETWQYFAGTGLAQGTDVIMNTLGCAVGVVPWVVVRRHGEKKVL